MRRAVLAALATVTLAACYAEWDLPRCGSVEDCPRGYTRCYTGYCLQEAVSGVEKAPFDVVSGPLDSASLDDSVAALPDAPQADTSTDSAPPHDTAPVDTAPDASPCAPGPADGCCPPGLLNLDQDPDCAVWTLSSIAFTSAAAAVDVDRSRLILAVRDGAGPAAIHVLDLATGDPTQDPLTLGAVPAPCPLLLPDGSAVFTAGGFVRRLQLGASSTWSQILVSGASGACGALHHPQGGAPAAVFVTDGVSPAVLALDAATGALRWTWSPPTKDALSPPLVRNGVVVTAAADGTLWRLDQGADPAQVVATSTQLPGPPLLPPSGAPGSGVHVLYGAPKPRLRTARFQGTGWAAPTGADDAPIDHAAVPGSEVVLLADSTPLVAHPTGFSVVPAPATDLAPCNATVRTAPAIAGAILLGTSRGAAAVTRSGSTVWCYDTGRVALLAPLPLPDGALLVGDGVVLRALAPTGPLATSPWPRPRHDLANSASLSL
ncbi:MAG: hypothetical protein AMXMBFR64_25090 [Myxococcales bacterium]